MNWKKTLLDILISILTLGISHVQKRKKKIEEAENNHPPGNESSDR